MTGLFRRLISRPIERLVNVACLLGLGALSLFVLSILFPKPLPIIGAMSIGHVLGGLAFSSYLLAVIADLARRRARASGSSLPPAPQKEPSDAAR